MTQMEWSTPNKKEGSNSELFSVIIRLGLNFIRALFPDLETKSHCKRGWIWECGIQFGAKLCHVLVISFLIVESVRQHLQTAFAVEAF